MRLVPALRANAKSKGIRKSKGSSPSRAKAAAIRRNPRLARDVSVRQTRCLRALRLLAVLRRLRSRAPPEDDVERAQPPEHRGTDEILLSSVLDRSAGVNKFEILAPRLHHWG